MDATPESRTRKDKAMGHRTKKSAKGRVWTSATPRESLVRPTRDSGAWRFFGHGHDHPERVERKLAKKMEKAKMNRAMIEAAKEAAWLAAIKAEVKREERERFSRIIEYGLRTGRNDLARQMYLTCQDMGADEIIAFMERVPAGASQARQ
jgi:hypothetical protein